MHFKTDFLISTLSTSLFIQLMSHVLFCCAVADAGRPGELLFMSNVAAGLADSLGEPPSRCDSVCCLHYSALLCSPLFSSALLCSALPCSGLPCSGLVCSVASLFSLFDWCNERSLWVTSMDVDPAGNFVYLGGGVQASSQTSAGRETSRAFHRAPTGWLASFFLSESNPSSPEEDATTLVKCAALPVPIQKLIVQGTELVTGGAQPVLTFWRSHSLGE
jgi:hypothetical protein